MNEGQLPDTWFCNLCVTSRKPPVLGDSGTFDHLLYILEQKNPSAFHLPKDVREYFEGVKTGAEGEYEEGVVHKPKNRAGWDEAPDYLRLKDTKGNTILCHQCHLSAASGKLIIPCSFCSLSWHLDCLDPPMANPPPMNRLWKCPCHIDDLLATVPGTLGPAHRFRKIKGASTIKPAISRGLRNNGHIEIENALSDEEDDGGFYEQREYGHVYKLPEEGVKLDFISRLRQKVHSQRHSSSVVSRTSSTKPQYSDFNRRNLMDQQAALNLAQFATQVPEYSAPGDAQPLIDALLTEASPEVITLMARASAPNLDGKKKISKKKDKQALLAMRALIDRQLASMDDSIEQEAEAKTTKMEAEDEVVAKDPEATTTTEAEVTEIETEATEMTATEANAAEEVVAMDEDVEMAL